MSLGSGKGCRVSPWPAWSPFRAPDSFWWFMFFLKIYSFIYLCAVAHLCRCALAFSSCGEGGLLFLAVGRLLVAVAFVAKGFSRCGTCVQQLQLPGSRAQAQWLWRTRIFSSISPPKKTRVCLLYCFVLSPLISLGAVPHHHLTL